MTNFQPTSLSDSAWLAETVRATGIERRATCDLLVLLAEVDRRKLYLGLGYSSMFAYGTKALRLSEPAAYSRITAARAAARFPEILTRLAARDVTLTSVALLARHLTDANHTQLLDAARHKSKRDVQRLVKRLAPLPDAASMVRRLPASDVANAGPSFPSGDVGARPARSSVEVPLSAFSESGRIAAPPQAAPRPVVAPLSANRYLLRVTLSDEAHANLQRARELLRHSIPNGDPAAIVERALAELLKRLDRTRRGASRRSKGAQPRLGTSRHVPAAVRRAVWGRDDGRCAFVGTDGRCGETGFLEFHHVVPFARGGPTTADNLELRCRAHNADEAERNSAACARTGAGAERPQGQRIASYGQRNRVDLARIQPSSVRTEFAVR